MEKSTSKSRPAPRQRLIDAALTLAGREDWRAVGMSAIAELARVDLAEALQIFRDKSSVIGGYFKNVDAAVLSDLVADGNAGEPAKDRLFDVLMRRFEIMTPHRDGLAGIVAALPYDPFAGPCRAVHLGRSMALMLEAAGLSSAGCGGMVRTKGLMVVYLCALRVWFRDDTADMAKTMAALDQSLTRADRLARMCWPSRPATDESDPEPAGS